MSIFTKELNEVDEKDLEKLIEEEYPEDLNLEYKKTLPSNKSQDPWISNQNKIGAKARNELIEEVIAFANSNGGILIVGIDETDSKPPRAKEFNLIPKISDLADRFKLQIRDCVEPKIPNVVVKGIRIKDEAGILAVKTEKSYQAPHRAIFSKECYKRRNDRSEKMSMREIKDLTLQSANLFQEIKKSLEDRSSLFHSNFQEEKIPFNKQVGDNKIAFRISLLPISNEIRFQNVHHKITHDDITRSLDVIVNGKLDQIYSPHFANQKRPIVRGVLFHGDLLNVVVKENGLIEYTIVTDKSKDGKPLLFGEWVLSSLYKSIMLLEKLKESYNLFDSEFVIEIEILTNQDDFFASAAKMDSSFNFPLVSQSNVRFPQYSYQDSNEVEELINLVNNDFANMCGRTLNFKIELA